MSVITTLAYTWNRPATVNYPGGMQRRTMYDGLMRPQTLLVAGPGSGGNALLEYAYTYDNRGSIVTKQTEYGNYGYGYDAASRLTSADNPVLDDESYTYDNVGNRTSASNAVPPPSSLPAAHSGP